MTSEQQSQTEPGGNTKPPVSNTAKQTIQRYRWQFTLKAEQPELIEPESIASNLKTFCKEFYFQLEMGKDKMRTETVNKGMPDEQTIQVMEHGYLHYQGCFSLIQKHRMHEVKNIIGWNNVHLEDALCWHALKNYSNKQETRVEGPWDHKTPWIKIMKPEQLSPWMSDIYSIISVPCDENRIIRWYWEPIGGIGKTSFCKFAIVKLGANVVRGGALKDIAFSLTDAPNIIMFDIPRTVETRVNYEAIEACKDGLIFSAKYESKMKIFNSPHVVCFANFPPDYEALSKDRWRVIRLGGPEPTLTLNVIKPEENTTASSSTVAKK